MSRGNGGNHIFIEDKDQKVFYRAPKKYVDKIRRTYLPPTAHDEMPQQKSLAREFNPSAFLAEASKKLKCDLNARKMAGRVSAQDKENRDLLIYILWKTGTVTNSIIGEQFGILKNRDSRNGCDLNIRRGCRINSIVPPSYLR